MSAFKKRGRDPQAKQRLILLAEDHPLNQKVALLLLDRMGFDVHVVNNGIEAVEAAKRGTYDAILMDCHMPELDGFDATKLIRQHEAGNGNHVPIIAVTALAMAGDRERCLAAGMDDYVTKPIDRDLLHSKLVHWMNPGTISAIKNWSKVIPIFESAFSLDSSKQDEPLNLSSFFDSYGEEAPDLLVLFGHSSARLINEMKEALATEDAALIARLSHEIKGASWAVGADEMARLAVFLEQAACQQNWRVIQRTLIRLDHHFADVQQYLERKLQATESTGAQC